MQNFHKRRRPITPKAFIGGVVSAVLVLALLFTSVFVPAIPAALARPLSYAGTSLVAGLGSLHYYLPASDETKTALDAQIAENQVLQNENRLLREKLADVGRLGAGAGLKPATVLAPVVARPPVSPYDTLLILTSENARVKKGAYVYGVGGVPIGTIDADSVNGSTRVVLFSSPGRSTAGWVGEKRLPLTLVGESMGAFSAKVPRETSVVEGDLVYLPAPAALPVGVVMHVDRDPASTDSVLHIAPYVNIFSLTWVEVAL